MYNRLVFFFFIERIHGGLKKDQKNVESLKFYHYTCTVQSSVVFNSFFGSLGSLDRTFCSLMQFCTASCCLNFGISNVNFGLGESLKDVLRHFVFGLSLSRL